VTAHQRLIRERLAEEAPRASSASLAGYSVETISRAEALPLILRYEWLGTLGPATIFIGLLSPTRELEGAACFGWGPTGPIRLLIGEPALCLERGACVHYAPRNAASFLINNACKLVMRVTGVSRFFAYSDPMAGEYGGVYQAAGWVYLGQGLNGKDGRAMRLFVLPPGKDGDKPYNWQTTRVLRRQKPRLSLPEARLAGWQIARRHAKHVYVINVGRDRKKWLKSLAPRVKAYPSPNPELKIKAGLERAELLGDIPGRDDILNRPA
jgi:hypothetical protein